MTVDTAEAGSNLALPFQRFGNDPVCVRRWPLSTRLSREIGQSPSLLGMVGNAPADKRQATDFLSAVHLHAMERPTTRLAQYFYSVRGAATRPLDDDVSSAFHEFVRTHHADIEETMRAVHVQTNEPARCLVLYPGLQLVADRTRSAIINLVDVGSGPGLTMIPHKYSYDYDGIRTGAARSPVMLRAHLVGDLSPPTLGRRPHVNAVGIDLQATYLDTPGQLAWSTACIFPEDAARIDRLRAATPLATGVQRPTIISGDANTVLVDVVSRLDNPGPVCVVTSFMQMYYSHSQRDNFVTQLSRAAEGRRRLGHEAEIWWLTHDWPMNLQVEAQQAVARVLTGDAPLDGAPFAPVVLCRVEPDGVSERVPLAVAEAYTDAIQWINPDFGRPRRDLAQSELCDLSQMSGMTLATRSLSRERSA